MIALFALLTAALAASPENPPAAAAALLSSLAADDLPAARAILSDDAMIMDDRSGRPTESTLQAFAASIRGCETAEVTWDVDGDEPMRAAVSVTWACPSRDPTLTFIWTLADEVVHIQFGITSGQPAAE